MPEAQKPNLPGGCAGPRRALGPRLVRLGEIFSLFPPTLADTFGSRNATTNYGFLYIAQGVGSILGGPVAAAMRVATGSWIPVFAVAVAMDVIAALLALFVLKPMRAKHFAKSRETYPAAGAVPGPRTT